MVFTNVATNWQVNFFFFSITKNETSKYTSNHMTNIFENKLLKSNLLIQLFFYIETSLI